MRMVIDSKMSEVTNCAICAASLREASDDVAFDTYVLRNRLCDFVPDQGKSQEAVNLRWMLTIGVRPVGVLGRHSGISFDFCFRFSRALVRAGEHRGVPRMLMVSSDEPDVFMRNEASPIACG